VTLRAKISTVKTVVVVLFCASLVTACGSTNTRDRDMKRLESSLRARGFRSFPFDRHSGLVGPPEIERCALR